MSRITRSPARPVSGVPSYRVDGLPVYRGGSAGGDGPTPPIGCAFPLSGDIALVYGDTPFIIDGQSVSFPDYENETLWASTLTFDFEEETVGGGIPLNWPSNVLRVFQLANTTFVRQVRPDDPNGPWIIYPRAILHSCEILDGVPVSGLDGKGVGGIGNEGTDEFMWGGSFGTPILTTAEAIALPIILGVTGGGDVYALLDGQWVPTGQFPAAESGGVIEVFPTAVFMPFTSDSETVEGEPSATLITFADDIVGIVPELDGFIIQDLCGNPVEVEPVPPITCSVTFTDDVAVQMEVDAMDIDGQVLSYAFDAESTMAIASTADGIPATNGMPLPEVEGTYNCVELRGELNLETGSPYDVYVGTTVTNGNGDGILIGCEWSSSSSKHLVVQTDGGDVYSAEHPTSDVVHVAIGADGSGLLIVNQVVVASLPSAAFTQVVFAGTFFREEGDDSVGTGFVEYVTAASEMALRSGEGSIDNEFKDWCGNDLLEAE